MIEAPAFDIETFTGKRFSIDFFDPSLIDIEDIAASLSMQCRYTGHCHGFYSVAEHSVLCSRWLEAHDHAQRIQILGLLHDAPEMLTGDLNPAIKAACPNFLAIEARAEAAVWDGLNIPPPSPEEHRIVKQADQALLATEAFLLMRSRGAGWGLVADRDPNTQTTAWEPDFAKAVFLKSFARLTGGTA